ncbi:hypothetical protein BR93DRAFT_957167 [Coniochaeta sp. PMI_546]|nr:hypothetical protein BR93DRAFT_957167 [Coniochaeta sp. PMI_546]
MPSSTGNIREVKPWINRRFVHDIAQYTMQNYYRSQEVAASPFTGFCIPVTPHTRLTNSPTGGVIGRYLAKPTDHASSLCTALTLSESSSAGWDPQLSPEVYHDPCLATQQPILNGKEAVVNLQLTPQSNGPPENDFTGDIPTMAKQASTASGKTCASHKPLDPADITFLFKTLDQQLKASSNVSLMTRLVPVHQGRPGEHILRLSEQTGELYACIPCNPFAPKSTVGQQEYSLPSYDSYIQQKASGGRRAKDPYPAVGNSSLNTCNHCQTPTKVLNNESLCPFHAYYLATGRFLGYYEFCALVEMEKHGLSISSGWWTIEDMVPFVDALAERIDKWRFLEESSPIPKGSWVSKVSPYGAIGEQVPQNARGKTAFQFGAEQTLAMAVGHQTDQTTVNLKFDQVYREATGVSCA